MAEKTSPLEEGGAIEPDSAEIIDPRNVSFSRDNGHNVSDTENNDGREIKMLTSDMRGVSVAKCDTKCHLIARIPTRVELKTLTHRAKRPAINIDFKEITFTVQQPLEMKDKGKKTILKNISGSFKSGELTAIIGSSGAGKSTLMNVIAGYVTIGVAGTIEANGHPRQLKLFNKLTSYIMQDDLLQPFLTVHESMVIAADLKLGKELSAEEKVQVVDEILITLGLSKTKDTRIEKLSGGQRKRLSVALELVSNPPVIFLDEPTTGLDTVATTQLMTALKTLARQGRTIICTIHQPTATIFKMFDLVYVMASGECMYQGTADQMVPFLERCGFDCPITYNPSDYVIEIITEKENQPRLCTAIQNGKLRLEPPDLAPRRKNGPKITKLCRKETFAVMPKVYSADAKDDDVNVEFPTTYLEQTWILLKRRIKQQARNKSILWIMFGHHIVSALLIGSIFYGIGNNGSKPFENVKFILSCVVFFMYTHVMCNVLLFPFEVKRLRREYFNRWYGLKAYYTAYTCSTIPQQVFFSILFTTIAYALSGQPLELNRLLWFLLVGFLIGLTSEGLGMTVGAIFKATNGSIIGPASVVPMLAMAAYGMGFGLNIEPFMQFLMYTSYLRYGIVGFCTAVYTDRDLMECEDTYCHYKDPGILLRDLGMMGSVPSIQAMALTAFILLFRGTAYLALRHRLSLQFSSRIFTFIAKLLRQR